MQVQQFQVITVKGVIGMYYRALEDALPKLWLGQIANEFNSNQEVERYPWLGQTPAMRQWVGPRIAKGLTENNISIRNLSFEGTLAVKRADMERDKTGQLQVRIGELAQRTLQHDARLLSTIINNGTGATNGNAWDAVPFFSAAHTYPAVDGSPTISNYISVDISTLPVQIAGSPTAPSIPAMVFAIFGGIKQLLGMVDEANEPVNDGSTQFICMVPLSLYDVARAAVTNQVMEGNVQNPLVASGNFKVEIVPNSRLTWTETIMVSRADSGIKPFIIQREIGPVMEVLGEGSDHTFKNDEYLFGVRKRGNVGYGDWTRACAVKLIASR